MEGMHVLFDRKHSSSPFLKICQPPDDSSWMKQAAVATSRGEKQHYLLFLYNTEHSLA
jgi:hypothetical protein